MMVHSSHLDQPTLVLIGFGNSAMDAGDALESEVVVDGPVVAATAEAGLRALPVIHRVAIFVVYSALVTVPAPVKVKEQSW